MFHEFPEIDDDDQLPGEEAPLAPPDDWPTTGPEDLALLQQVERTPWQDWLATPGPLD